jgi:hypothetical protein
MSAEPKWIISRAGDLIWLQGSVLPALLLLAFFRLAPPLDASTLTPSHPAVIALLLWGVLFDGTHVMGTWARTYLAPDAVSRAQLPRRRWWGLLALGPALAVIDHWLCPPGPVGLGHPGAVFAAFLLVAYLWAYWHLVRQHYGFVALYRRREGAKDPIEARLETALLWVGCLGPYVRFSLTDAFLKTGLPVLLPTAWLPLVRGPVTLAFVAAGALLAGALLWRTRSLGPRHLLIAIVIAFHCAVFALLDNLLTITATLTLFHNLQYHRIVWQYEQGRGRIPLGSVARYLAFGLLLGLAWYGPRVMGVAAAGSDLLRNVLIGLGWGVAFHHYLVDGRIWKVRRSAHVGAAIDAGRPASPMLAPAAALKAPP